ncbi:MAG: DUF29 domain-containing protein [Candidatus Competibacteraceae bacterium]
MGKAPYEGDFYGWTQEQASLLRAGRLAELDVEHLIEEIESMGRSERRQLTNRFELLLMHLLKWHYQLDRREIDGKSWLRTIREQRRKIPKLIRDNPSLQSLLEECVRDAYEDARFAASDETGLLVSAFPELCPYTLEQILDGEFLPNP